MENFDEDERTIEEYNQDMDSQNIDEIDRYIEQKKEYDKKGYYTAFMGLKVYEEPKDPEFFDYK